MLSKSDEADRAMRLRALLSAIVELNRAERDAGDLASELQFLAENLDDQRDYAFMRP
ncbi:putative 4-hydroxy-3-methylbut-2-enyl diphosphate reductase [Pseudomonas aeruginosa]|nr:putative 4-hydroxy-3-methylbut-2-enyl diphosphate reductase [Pseudomonas aeruginosa]RAL79848.1 putative 4-hydroxy-3-methylbut-2-enyl diphosphate reductase [Pseudomonas aeruginosa]RCH07974.1 putative 4-hydroxy-3-methylbut-2-enyl diphosphate reductase [Pseudomonas aeruginosa]